MKNPATNIDTCIFQQGTNPDGAMEPGMEELDSAESLEASRRGLGEESVEDLPRSRVEEEGASSLEE